MRLERNNVVSPTGTLCFLERQTQRTPPEMTPFSSCHVHRIQHDHVRACPAGEFTHSIVDDIVSPFDRAIERKSRLYRRTALRGVSGFMLRLRVQGYVHVVQNLFEHLRRWQGGRFRFGQGLIRPEKVLLVGNLECRWRGA